MATTVKATLNFGMLCTEVLDAAIVPGANAPTVIHNKFETKITLDGASTPPVSFVSEQAIASSASGTIDFTSLPTTQGARTAVPLKLRGLRIVNNGTHLFSLAVGGTNGYAIGGSAINVQPKSVAGPGCIEVFFADGLLASDATHKTLDYTFNAGDAGPVNLTLLLG